MRFACGNTFHGTIEQPFSKKNLQHLAIQNTERQF